MIKKRIACLTLPLTVGGLSALLTRSNINLNKPFIPPRWLFVVVWAILFALMGIATYLVASRSALTVYSVRLLFNFV